MTVQWGLLVEETSGSQQAYATRVLEHLTGTREEALARLEQWARSYRAETPKVPSRTRLYRTSDGFLLVNQGTMRDFGCRFLVAELLWDSEVARQEEAAARVREKAERKAARQAARQAERKARRL